MVEEKATWGSTLVQNHLRGSGVNYTLYKVDDSKKKQKGLDVSIQHISGSYPG